MKIPQFFAVSLLLVACGTGKEEPQETRATAANIIGGTDSGTEQDETILLVDYEPARLPARIERCTGTLIAPNLVLTARHCVSEITRAAASCTDDGVGKDYPAAALHVFIGPESPGDLGREATYAKAAAKGKKIFTDGATNLCGHDIALVLLDRAIPNAKIAPVRLDGKPRVGDKVTAIGWGMTETTTQSGSEPAVRQQRKGVAVTALGPAEATSEQAELAAPDFQVGESICSGDSGGPAVSEATGAVIGVVSRGGNGKATDPAGCQGPDTDNVYTGTASFKDLISSAYAEAGQSPWAEGEPDPRKAKFGGSCQRGDDCQSNVCYQEKCSLSCVYTTCPTGLECAPEGTTRICKVVAAIDAGSVDAGNAQTAEPTTNVSCAAGPAKAPSTPWAALAMTAFAVFAIRRRKA